MTSVGWTRLAKTVYDDDGDEGWGARKGKVAQTKPKLFVIVVRPFPRKAQPTQKGNNVILSRE